MTDDLDRLIDAVIDREGGFVSDPADRGGATRWGVTQAIAKANGYTGDMHAYPRAAAIDVYRRLYWFGPGTLAAYLARRKPGGEAVLVKAIEALQGERYLSLAEHRPADEAFLYGWLANRIG